MSDPLERVPGLGGYLSMRRLNQEQEANTLGQAAQMMSLRSAFTQADEGAKVRQVMQTETDPEKVIQALMQLGPTGAAAAHQYATAIKEATTAKALKDLNKGGALNLDDPDALMRASMIPGMAHLGPEAERLRRVRENRAALTTLRDQPPQALPAGTPVPGTNQQTVMQVPPEDRAAFMRVANGEVRSAPQPADAQPTGGLFTSLMTSKNPAISNQAKMMQARLNASGEAVPAAHWLDIQKNLAAQDVSSQQRQQQATQSRVPAGYRMTPEGNLERIPVVGGTTASDDALTNDAWFSIINGKARPGSLPLGKDEGNKYREQLREKIGSIAKDIGITPQALATLGPENKSKFMALNAVEKDLASIRPFDAMLDTNAKIAIDLAKKISNDRTNSQFLNRPITWLEQNAADNPDIAEYLFQIQTVKTEGARILNNPRLVGQLTDSARGEMANVVNGNMPLGQTTRVLERMMSDGKNRVHAIEQEGERLRSEIRGSASGAPAASTPPAAPTAAPQYPTATALNGRKVIFKDGKWQTP